MTRSSGPTPILVLGMHRSGLSALAGVLRLLGVELGWASGTNEPAGPHGNGAPPLLVTLHNRLLGSLNASWDDPRSLPEAWWRRTEMMPFREELLDAVERSFGDAPLWAINDPRLCRLLPLWREILQDLGHEPRCVLLLRHPNEVAESLRVSNGSPASRSHMLWLQHILDAEGDTREWPRVVVKFDRLLGDWRSEVDRMEEVLGLTWLHPVASVAVRIDRFLVPSQRHHAVGTTVPREVPPWIGEAYDLLATDLHRSKKPTLAALTKLRKKVREAARYLELGDAPGPAQSSGPRFDDTAFADLLCRLEDAERALTDAARRTERLEHALDVRDQHLFQIDQKIDAALTSQQPGHESSSKTDDRVRQLERQTNGAALALTAASAERQKLRTSLEEARRALKGHDTTIASLSQRLAELELTLNAHTNHLAHLDAKQTWTTDLLHMLWVSKPWQAYLKFKKLLRAVFPSLHDSLSATVVGSDRSAGSGEDSSASGWELARQRADWKTNEQERLQRDTRRRLLVLDQRLPTPDQDSGSVRAVNLLRLFQNAFGFDVTLIPENLHADQPYTRQLELLGIRVLTRPLVPSVKEYLEEWGATYDCVVVSRAPTAISLIDDVRRHCRKAKVLFDTVDLHYLRTQRQAQHENDKALQAQAEQLKREELAAARRADATIVVSPVEQEVLTADAPGLNVHVVSNIIEVPGCRAPFDARKDILFIGGFEHPPNVDAARWLVHEILPFIRRRLPSIHLYVIGSKPTAEVEALASDGVTVTGHVADVTPFFRDCRLSVAPLRFGAGVKGKVNLSLSHGVPCVMTSLAAEGMGLQPRVDALIGDNADTFADHVVTLYQNRSLWESMSARGLDNVRERFSLETARRALEATFQSVDLELQAA